MRRIALKLAILGLWAGSAAAQDLAALGRDITGNGPSRKWSVERVLIFKSVTGGCLSGKTYEFRLDGTVSYTWCGMDHVFHKTVGKWRLGTRPDGQATLQIGNQVYLVKLRKDSATILRLQRTAADSQIADNVEITMTAVL